MKELVQKVKQWGIDRGLDKAGHLAQAKYTLKETAELLDAYADSNIVEINDAIGDILVTLIVGASNDAYTSSVVSEHLLGRHFCKPQFSRIPAFKDGYLELVDDAMTLLDKSGDKKVKSGPYMSVTCRLQYVLSIVNVNFEQSLSLKDCLQLAYNEIKDRTGKTNEDGHFIKD